MQAPPPAVPEPEPPVEQPQPQQSEGLNEAGAGLNDAAAGKKAFEVSLTLTKGEYPGMCLDMSEGAFLRVSKVDRRGPVPDYNAAAPEDEQIKDGHFIVAVNASKGDGREMMTVLFNGGAANLAF